MQTSLSQDLDARKALERSGFIKRNFKDLRGLLTAWMGLACLLVGICFSSWYSEELGAVGSRAYDVRAYFVFLLAFIGVGMTLLLAPGFWALSAYYRGLGLVRPSERRCPSFLTLLIASLILFDFLRPLGIAIYACFGLPWIAQGLARPQLDRLFLGLGFLAFGAFQSMLAPAAESANLALAVGGAACIAVGMLDHRFLVSALAPTLARSPIPWFA